MRVRPSVDRAAVISALFGMGAEGIQELDDEILTHFRDADELRLRDAISRADPEAHMEFRPASTVDWTAAWRSGINAHHVGPLVVTPPWLADQFAESERVVIDPGMAFGTGEHETTRGVIRLLAPVLRAGDGVADLGAGSAVLAIAAAKLGAGRVVAIELDPDAIGNAEENVQRNRVSAVVNVIEGDAGTLVPLLAPFRIIMANIISSVLLQLLPTIADALEPGGVAIVSGILVDEEAGFRAALWRSGWRVLETDQDGIWWSASIAR